MRRCPLTVADLLPAPDAGCKRRRAVVRAADAGSVGAGRDRARALPDTRAVSDGVAVRLADATADRTADATADGAADATADRTADRTARSADRTADRTAGGGGRVGLALTGRATG
jgi:hypothetical protein